MPTVRITGLPVPPSNYDLSPSNGCLEMMELEREMMDAIAPERNALEDIQKPGE